VKSTEELLRDEVRAVSAATQGFVQWGLTLQVSLMTALFFIRKDLAGEYVQAGLIKSGQPLPLDRYLVGTGFLLIIALLLWRISLRHAEQYRNYKNQLIDVAARGSGIRELPVIRTGRWMNLLFFTLPLVDLLIRVYISIDVQFR
jgi:hypothetical protein